MKWTTPTPASTAASTCCWRNWRPGPSVERPAHDDRRLTVFLSLIALRSRIMDFRPLNDTVRRRPGAALRPQAVPQRLPGRDAPGGQLPDRAARDAHPDAAEALPPPAGGADALPVAAGQHKGHQPLGPGPLHVRLRRPGRLA